MFNIYDIHDVSVFNLPYVKLYHMHIALHHVVLTQYILLPHVTRPSLSIWKLNIDNLVND